MTVSNPRLQLGRHLFGAAAFALGVVALVWPDYRYWDQLRPIFNDTTGPIFVYAVAACQIIGGAAIQFNRTALPGAVVLAAGFSAFALSCVPAIFAEPQIYNSWGNFFEQLSLVTGALILYARFSLAWQRETLDRVGRILLGICTASFAAEQAFYLNATAKLVPKWIPPSQSFWAITTTGFFALAALALLSNRYPLLAARLLTTMIVVFGLLVWVPLLLSDFHNHTNWSECAETFAIAGVAWILADVLGGYRLNGRPS